MYFYHFANCLAKPFVWILPGFCRWNGLPLEFATVLEEQPWNLPLESTAGQPWKLPLESTAGPAAGVCHLVLEEQPL